MPGTSIPSAERISADEFKRALSKYPSLLQAVSGKKGAKDGQQTLAELDKYRYEEIVESLARTKPSHTLDLEQVKKLVQWKLRHGKFRPTLTKLVSSNEPATANAAIDRAIKLYRDKADVAGTLSILCELRGIGPATASLLLAVHDPKNVIFFGDEVFYWLCCDSKMQSAKYNAKEYAALSEKATAVATRLGATMVEIEKVAYVVMKEGEYPYLATVSSDSQASSPKTTPTATSTQQGEKESKLSKKTAAAAKRKEMSDSEIEDATLRRSKRGCKGMRRT